MTAYLTTVNRIIDFLYQHQAVAEDQDLLFHRNESRWRTETHWQHFFHKLRKLASATLNTLFQTFNVLENHYFGDPKSFVRKPNSLL